MQHDDQADATDDAFGEAQEIVDRVRESPYFQHVRRLADRVSGKQVDSSSAGRSGFLLRFADDTWVTCYVADEQVQWAGGPGEPSDSDLAVIEPDPAGAPSTQIGEDRAQVGAPCNIAAQVCQSHGKTVTRVGIGDDCFSLCFPDGCELAMTIALDENGRPSLRIAWEEW